MTHKIDQENRGPWEVCKNLTVPSHADKITTAPNQKPTLEFVLFWFNLICAQPHKLFSFKHYRVWK